MEQTSREAALWARYRDHLLAAEGPWNQVIETLLAHRSVRAYLPDPLPAGALETIVAAAQSAASSSNLQVWDVVAIEDPDRKARLSMLAGGQAHIREAPLFLVWIADLARAEAMAKAADREADGINYFEMLITAIVDTSLAAQNAMVAAESLGLGAVYIGAMRNHIDQVAAELKLPHRAFGVFGMAIGHPDPARPAEVKPRLPQRVVLHRETFQPNVPLDAIAEYDQTAVLFQREQAMREIGWTRSVLSRLKNAEALKGRDNIKQLLQARGFEMR